MKQRTHGFTIVELLIVIVVVGILAAISIVAYSGVSNNAYDTTIKSDLANFAKQAQLYHAEKGVYPTHASSALGALGLKVSVGAYDVAGYNLYYCTNAGVNSKFSFAAKSKSGNIYHTSSSGSGVVTGNLVMGGGRACAPIGEVPGVPSGNLNYAYDFAAGAWAGWVN